jgi:hypothetical protein
VRKSTSEKSSPAELWLGSRPEERLLLHCLRQHYAAQRKNCSQTGADSSGNSALAEPEVPGPSIDWNRLERLAEAHHVFPLLCHAILKEPAIKQHKGLCKRMEARGRGLAMGGTYRAAQLVEILAALRAGGIAALPLKGPVLAAGAYGNLGLRESCDLDILVAPDDAARCAAVLAELGFGDWNVPAKRLAAHLRSESEHNFFCDKRKIAVDLHWALSRPYFPLALPFADLWARRRGVALGGHDVGALSPPDALLHLCFHGAKHNWEYLGLVCDVAAMLAAEPGVDWQRLLSLARKSGTRRILLLGLHLSCELMGSQVPPDIARQIGGESILRSLTANARRHLNGHAPASSTLAGQAATALFFIRIRERLIDRLRYCFWAAVPNMRDWEASRLPAWLWFVHILSRPMRLLKRYSGVGRPQWA